MRNRNMQQEIINSVAFLVPLHDKVKKWAKAKLVDNNKKIRRGAAKKIIEQLEKNKLINRIIKN